MQEAAINAWSLTGPGSLSNSTGLSVTYNSPTTNLTGGQPATVMATSGADQTERASVQITVNPYPRIPFQTLANGSVRTPSVHRRRKAVLALSPIPATD